LTPTDPSSRTREAKNLRWGLVPSWSKDASAGYRTINTRAGTLETKPAFKEAFRQRRCLIPTTGFYEWKKTPGRKQPYVIRRRDQRVFAFAGLWERWEREGEVLETCSIVTTDANALVAPIHDRMPVILEKESYEEWLDPAQTSPEALRSLLVPEREDVLEAIPIVPLVSHPSADGPELLKPYVEPEPAVAAAAPPEQRSLLVLSERGAVVRQQDLLGRKVRHVVPVAHPGVPGRIAHDEGEGLDVGAGEAPHPVVALADASGPLEREVRSRDVAAVGLHAQIAGEVLQRDGARHRIGQVRQGERVRHGKSLGQGSCAPFAREHHRGVVCQARSIAVRLPRAGDVARMLRDQRERSAAGGLWPCRRQNGPGHLSRVRNLP
jgi:putative SOS response-associated peptidase YedK